jgi:hypothetical protein
MCFSLFKRIAISNIFICTYYVNDNNCLNGKKETNNTKKEKELQIAEK